MSKKFRYDAKTDSVVEVGQQSRSNRDWKPLHCEAMAVNPNEVTAAKALDEKLGAGSVDYDAHGAPVFHDNASYKRYLKAHGYINVTSGKGNNHMSEALLDRLQKRLDE